MSDGSGGLPPVFVVGYPGALGGASTECWHTVKLWRRHGLPVHLINTWGDPPKEWRDRCGSIGCVTHRAEAKPDSLRAVPGLRGGIVVSFCNDAFLATADLFRGMGCRVVWVGCMNWLFPHEKRHYRAFGPFERYVTQSKYQYKILAGELARWGVRRDQIHLIRGAFDAEEFEFCPRPHAGGEDFVIGRISRAAAGKFSPGTWALLDRVDYPHKRYRILGWAPELENVLGRPPAPVEVIPMLGEPVDQFLGSLHCYCQLNGADVENWPRTGLEAMAAGVPIVAEARGGWSQMIEHRRTGFVCGNPAETAHWIAHLAYDEDARQEIARRAWHRLVTRLAEPEELWGCWRYLFEYLDAESPAPRPDRNGRRRRREKISP